MSTSTTVASAAAAWALGGSSSNTLPVIDGIPSEVIAQLSKEAQDYIRQAPELILWKVLADVSNVQRERFRRFTGVATLGDQPRSPMETAIALTARLSGPILHVLSEAINSQERLERFIAWEQAPRTVLNYTAGVCNIQSNVPEGWHVATAIHCCMIADFGHFEEHWRAAQLRAMSSSGPSPAQGPGAQQQASNNPWPAPNSQQVQQARSSRQSNGDYNDSLRRDGPPPGGFSAGRWGEPPHSSSREDYNMQSDRFGFHDYNQGRSSERHSFEGRFEGRRAPWEGNKRQRPDQSQKPSFDEGMISQVAYECNLPDAVVKTLSEGKFVRAAEAFIGLTVTLGASMKLEKEKPRMVSDDINGVNMSIGALMRAHAMFFPQRQGTNADHLKSMESLVEVYSIRGVWMIDALVRQHCDTYGLPYFPPPCKLTYEIMKAGARFPRTTFSHRSCAHCGGDHGSEACRFKDVHVYQPEQRDRSNRNTRDRDRGRRDRGRGKGKGGGTPKAGGASAQNATPPPPPAAQGVCRDFLAGKCNRAAKCKFSH
jgi:hypothetical protein